ncbi:hypothetical protein GWI33_012896 [Rhynchophorus ferrugineus]|uniref:Uncharacterized protein n=1 Tax=Rhynchophorus ferrugineus TaxID=354439 RepID=A0A834IAH4_RHYFE|nr:hypothetical protein GWI33_012896 [Rhynchophorus ferrugineus]
MKEDVARSQEPVRQEVERTIDPMANQNISDIEAHSKPKRTGVDRQDDRGGTAERRKRTERKRRKRKGNASTPSEPDLSVAGNELAARPRSLKRFRTKRRPAMRRQSPL